MRLDIEAQVTGLVRYFEAQPDVATEALRMSINTVAERSGMKLLREKIEEQVDFPPGYLRARGIRLARKAYNSNMEAVIAARERPTSLARFARSGAATGNRRGGVTVRVQPGSTRTMPTAFLMRLRAGQALTDENFNLGLAIRLKPGERVLNKKVNTVQLGRGLQMLYGPSVAQVFDDVAEEQTEPVLDLVETEFFRNYDRLSEVA